IRSSGPQLADTGSFPARSVISPPITAKSPVSSSKMSGQPLHPAVFAPPACGSEPSLRMKIVRFIASTITNVLVKSNNFFQARYHRSGMGRNPKSRRDPYGAWLYHLRKERNLTQQQLSELTGISQRNI